MEPHKIKDVAVTIIDVSVHFPSRIRQIQKCPMHLPNEFFFSLNVKVFDQSALSLEAKEEMYKLFPNARRAHLKTGGNFPYLCRSAEVNLYVQVGFTFVNGTYNKVQPFLKSTFCTYP